MQLRMLMSSLAILLAGCATAPPPAGTAPMAVKPGEMILVRQTAKTPDQAIEAIKTYTEGKKWVYMGVNRVKPPQGEVAFVKVCIPAVGAILWPLGLELSALLPCGNLGVYQKNGGTEVSMLHPRYIAMLYPHPETTRASELATAQLTEMLEAVIK